MLTFVLLMQNGVDPDQVPSARHLRLGNPSIPKPRWQEKMAFDP